MATRILGPTGSKKRRRFLFVPMLCIAALALFWIGSAQAVHELGVFQLDGNPWVFAPSGTNASQPNYASRTDAGQLPEDWDLICIKHLNTLTNEPGTCNNDTGYVLPNAGTLNAAVTNATATTITVQETGGNDVPVLNPSATNPFAIQIANTCTTPTSCAGTAEEMLVTGRSPATAAGGLHDYTVQRGFNSTVADNHAAAARVYIGTFSNPSSFKTDLVKNSSDDVLTQGTKDDNDIPSWTYKFGSEGTAKDDLNHAFAAEYTCGNTTACTSHNAVGHKILMFGGDRWSNNGTANLAFWFFQHRVQEAPGGVFTTNGQALAADGSNQATHKAGDVSLGCNIIVPGKCTPGDLLIISAFGPHAQLQVYEWVGVGNAQDLPGTNSCFTADCSLQPLLPQPSGACEDVTGDPACAAVNETNSILSPWHLNGAVTGGTDKGQKESGSTTTFEPTNFFEGGIDLTTLQIDACFSSFALNSRASSTGDAELHDVVIGQFARCSPTMTTQQSATADVQPGTPVTDRATIQVTGAANPDDPVGNVTFYICKQSELTPVDTGFCSGTAGTQVGTTAVNLSDAQCSTDDGSLTDGHNCAVSASVNGSTGTYPSGPLDPGRYCFRAHAVLTNYDNPPDFSDSETECFNVVKLPTDIKSKQSWYPNDTATVCSNTCGTLKTPNLQSGGTLDFYLYNSADCSAGTNNANLKYSERLSITGGATSQEKSTSNYPGGGGTPVPATATPAGTGGVFTPFAITTAYADIAGSASGGADPSTGSYSWLIKYTPSATDATHFGSSSACVDAAHTEKFSTTYTNDNGHS